MTTDSEAALNRVRTPQPPPRPRVTHQRVRHKQLSPRARAGRCLLPGDADGHVSAGSGMKEGGLAVQAAALSWGSRRLIMTLLYQSLGIGFVVGLAAQIGG